MSGRYGVFRFDVETGRRELWKELVPSDAAGVEEPQGGAWSGSLPTGSFTRFSVRARSFGALRRGSSPIGPDEVRDGASSERLRPGLIEAGLLERMAQRPAEVADSTGRGSTL